MREGITKKQSGFTLIEIMIAGVIGLLLLSGMIQLFLGSKLNYNLQNDLALMQEDGRFGLLFMNEQIGMAGWTTPLSTKKLPAINLSISNDGQNDVIAVTSIRAIDGINNRDCNDHLVKNGVVTNTFSVNSRGDLRCNGQPIIQGIESFQVLYGMETDRDCPDGLIDRYMTSEEVKNAGLRNHALAVRVGILLKSSKMLRPKNKAKSFQVLDQVIDRNDRYIRRLFQTTIFMPNSAFNILFKNDSALKCLSGD